tara:strand:- start:285 stop:428 length:144 start_codon:yes stop_codon:yes gene_type:complete
MKSSKGIIKTAPKIVIILLGFNETVRQIRNMKIATTKDENSMAIPFL